MNSLRRMPVVGMAILLASAVPGGAAAQSSDSAKDSANIRADVGWLGLYTPRMVEWTENRNASRSLQHTVTLRTGPGREAASAGTLVMTSSPEHGLRVAFQAADGATPIGFSPDFDVQNCTFFHHSYRERRGDWFRLTEGPWPRDTWVDWNDLAGEMGHHRLERDDIVESPWGNIVILGIGARFMRFRAEQERDMWMDGEGEQPPVASFKERRVQISDLFSASGKMRVTLRYPCGC